MGSVQYFTQKKSFTGQSSMKKTDMGEHLGKILLSNPMPRLDPLLKCYKQTLTQG